MSYKNNSGLTVARILYPIALLALILFVAMAFQLGQVLRDRTALHEARAQQDQPFEDTQKVRTQLDALAVGTLKLAQAGNKNAKTIINQLKEMGITVRLPEAAANAPAGTTGSSAALPSKP
ncbi:MAG: hypothetical protein SFW62_02395 [Alphaproteobacteria bacterium]|nr:hypothetical protein [Alphaproteobacteria bacterium]